MFRFVPNNKRDSERIIMHYQLQGNPGDKIPDKEALTALLNRTERDRNLIESGPIMVHCDAGVGKTGVYIALHSLINEINNGSSAVNVSHRIYEMRKQRGHMVDTREQYEFIYAYLKE